MSTTREKRRTLCIGSLKGGGGKSNLASNLAVAYQRLGLKPAIIDADKTMDTSARWADDREAYIAEHPSTSVERVHTVKKNGRLGATIREMAETYPIVIVDTGGQSSVELNSALTAVDVLVTPVEPTQESLDGIEPLLEVADQARDFNENLEVVVVLSRVPAKGHRRIAEAMEYLAGYTEDRDWLTIADAHVASRVAYPDAKAEGLAVVDVATTTTKDARREIEDLATELLTTTKGR